MCACYIVSVVSVCDLMDCSRQAPLSIGILQARMLEWVPMPSSRGCFSQRSNPGLMSLA